jgi:hypothetical protein
MHVWVGDGAGAGADGTGVGDGDGAGEAAPPDPDDVAARPSWPADAARPAPGEPPGAATGWAGSERVGAAGFWWCGELCPAAGGPGW